MESWRIRLVWLLVAYSIFILVLTHLPPDNLPSSSRFNDKVVHFLVYAGWGVIASLIAGRTKAKGLFWMAFGAVLAFGDELTQPYFGRQMDLWDWGADCLGLLVSYCGVRLMLYIGRTYCGLEYD